jgi:hypothetical protein
MKEERLPRNLEHGSSKGQGKDEDIREILKYI